MSLIQASEVDNSNQMEKKGFIEILQMFKDEKYHPYADYDRPSYSNTQVYE